MKKTETNVLQPEPEQWLDRFGDTLYRYALSRVPSSEIAEDMVQETLVAAIQSHPRFKGQSSIKTWLIAILKRKIVDYYRRVYLRQESDGIDGVSDHLNTLFDRSGHWRIMPASWYVDPDSAYRQKEFMEILFKCLAGLPKRLADIFMMREFDELSTAAICKQLGISESNSWVMLYRARMQLRNCLQENWLMAPE